MQFHRHAHIRAFLKEWIISLRGDEKASVLGTFSAKLINGTLPAYASDVTSSLKNKCIFENPFPAKSCQRSYKIHLGICKSKCISLSRHSVSFAFELKVKCESIQNSSTSKIWRQNTTTCKTVLYFIKNNSFIFFPLSLWAGHRRVTRSPETVSLISFS